jgi:V/A-type H+-transporting ATPase subunit A
MSWSESFSRDAEVLGAAHILAGDIDWATRRSRILGLLNESDRLTALTDLVGVGALPGEERMVLLGGRLLREGVLQQSAEVPNDAHCAPEKTAALVDAVLAVIDTCQDLASGGVSAQLVEETDFGPLIRAREDGGPTDTALAAQGRDIIIARLHQLR